MSDAQQPVSTRERKRTRRTLRRVAGKTLAQQFAWLLLKAISKRSQEGD